MKKLLVNILLNFNFLAVVILGIAIYSSFRVIDFDFWSRIACGSMTISNKWVIYNDSFSFIPTKNFWVDHEWLSEIIFFLVYKYFSDIGILVIKLVLLFSSFISVLMAAYIRYQYKQNILFYVLIILALFPAFASNIRPHDFTYLFFSLWLCILEYSRQKKTTKYLFILPISIVLWVNLHAGCLAGIALLFVYTLGQLIQKQTYKAYLISLILSLLAMILNPYGYNYYMYIFNELTASHSSISEWDSVDIFNITSFIYFKILLILTLIGFIFSKLPKKDPVAIILLSSLGIIGFKVARHNILYAIVAGVFVYEHIYSSVINTFIFIKDKISPRVSKNLVFTVKFVPALLILIFSCNYLMAKNPFSWKLEIPPSVYPVGCVEFMKINSIKSNLLLPFGWGGYTTWFLYPDVKVSADGRFVEIFDLSMFEMSNNFYYAKDNWLEILQKYPVDAILIEKKSPVFKKMTCINNFSTVFSDKYSVLLLKNDFKHKKLVFPNYLNGNFIPNPADSYFMRLK